MRWDFGRPGIEDERQAYQQDLERVRTFIEQRPAIIREQMRELVAGGQDH